MPCFDTKRSADAGAEASLDKDEQRWAEATQRANLLDAGTKVLVLQTSGPLDLGPTQLQVLDGPDLGEKCWYIQSDGYKNVVPPR